MNSHPFPEWGAIQSGAQFSNPSKFKERSTMFERKIRRRNIIEYIAGLFGVGVFAWVGWNAAIEGEVWVAAAWSALIIGTLVVLFNLKSLASNLPHMPEQSCQSHLRSQMEHQRKALDTAGRWYIAPLIPGWLIVHVSMIEVLARQTEWLIAVAVVTVPAVLGAAFFVWIIWINKRGARKLAGEIAELDRAAAPSPA